MDDWDRFIWDEAKAQRETMTVAALLKSVAQSFRQDYGDVTLTAEIHSVSRASSGHIYITLKDHDVEATLSACLFRNAQTGLSFAPKVGDVVEARGNLSVYEPRGQMNFIIKSLNLAGDGLLYAKFIELKNKLAAEGLFDDEQKKSIPRLPERIGIVTSTEAAALLDVLRTLRENAPNVSVVVYPASVQGEASEAELINALARAEERQEVDVLLIVRGGGSLTDLWTFNSEALARKIASMTLPTVSGVGHESDVTICDLVANYRAATPTAAALKVAEGWMSARDKFSRLSVSLACDVKGVFEEAHARLTRIGTIGKRLEDMIYQKAEHFDWVASKLLHGPQLRVNLAFSQFRALQERFESAKPDFPFLLDQVNHKAERLEIAVKRQLTEKEFSIKTLENQLSSLEFNKMLERGYSITTLSDGKILRQAFSVREGERLVTQIASGRIESKVTQLLEKK